MSLLLFATAIRPPCMHVQSGPCVSRHAPLQARAAESVLLSAALAQLSPSHAGALLPCRQSFASQQVVGVQEEVQLREQDFGNFQDVDAKQREKEDRCAAAVKLASACLGVRCCCEAGLCLP
jgi:hypothetical protein